MLARMGNSLEVLERKNKSRNGIVLHDTIVESRVHALERFSRECESRQELNIGIMFRMVRHHCEGRMSARVSERASGGGGRERRENVLW